jgi:hypothetical protein
VHLRVSIQRMLPFHIIHTISYKTSMSIMQ